MFSHKTRRVDRDRALAGRQQAIEVAKGHMVLDSPLEPPYPEGSEIAEFGMGCFWGAERIFWKLPGVISTSVGYADGITANPTYHEVCSGRTGHAEVVRVVYDPARISYERLLAAFWEGHDPTQGMRQGNDVGTQYRSIIITHSSAQHDMALRSMAAYQGALLQAGKREITTDVVDEVPFYFAEDYHQQYLAKHPAGYCGLGGTGVACPSGLMLMPDRSGEDSGT